MIQFLYTLNMLRFYDTVIDMCFKIVSVYCQFIYKHVHAFVILCVTFFSTLRPLWKIDVSSVYTMYSSSAYLSFI